jgi:DNA-binding LacI/PurR family transcriptional regulator
MADPVPPTRVSLRDIGRLANLSHSTVSLALRDHPSIAAKTRQRVRELATSLGYVPDPMLRALAEYRRDKAVRRYQGSLAWINNHPVPLDLENNKEFALYHRGAEERAAELGYKLVNFTPAAEKMTMTALRRVLLSSGIRGVLFAPQPRSHVALDFDFSGFSAVAFGFTISEPQLHVVTNWQFRSSMNAARHLRALGYKRIGFIISAALNKSSEGNFLGGFLAEQMSYATKERIPAFIATELQKDKSRFEQWYKIHRPDALIADFFEWTMVFLKGLNLRIPEDMPLAILSVVPDSTRFAGIDQNDQKIGRLGVDTVVGMIYRNETGTPETPTRILVEGQWRDGESVPIRRNSPVSDTNSFASAP